MMKFSKIIILSAFAAGIVFTGCNNDDNSVKPITEFSSPYYPLEEGSGYVYRTSTLDSGNVETNIRFDSVSITSAGSQFGKAAFMETTFNEGNTLKSELVSRESKAAYRYFTPITLDSAFPIVYPKRWIKEADFNTSINTWVTVDTSVTEIPVRFGTQNGVDSGTVTARIVQTRTKSASIPISYGIPAKTVQAIEITSTTNFKGTVTTAGVGQVSVPIEFNDVEKIYYADSIGIVKRHRDSYTIKASFIERNVPGFDYTLQTYTKK
ncbi:MAG: hypothetical protein V4642_01340 [Bacteroidota bacterium]